jgi:hypothetical protein
LRRAAFEAGTTLEVDEPWELGFRVLGGWVEGVVGGFFGFEGGAREELDAA